jgi:SAM-dependent methyltransferase
MGFERNPSLDMAAIFGNVQIGRPEIEYTGPPAIRDSREFMSVISALLPSASHVLDLGCGPRDQAAPIEHLGHQYVGFDYSGDSADFLADAHAIPFADSSLDCVFSYAVFEHLHNPFVALQEVWRVLKPGGYLVGSLSHGEPFHQSYFHLTPWGLVSLIHCIPSLTLTRMWPSDDTLRSLSRIGRYPRLIRLLLRGVDMLHRKLPVLAPRKMRWGQHDRMLDELYRAASLCFCARKGEEHRA